MKAPVRDVVRVIEMEGERGGRLLVCVLDCGCFATRRSRLPPPKKIPCIACFVANPEGAAIDPDWRTSPCPTGGCGCKVMHWWRFCPGCGARLPLATKGN